MGGSDNKGDGLASQPHRYRVPGQPLLNRHQVGGVSRSPDGLLAQQKREPIRGRPTVRGKRTYGGRPGQMRMPMSTPFCITLLLCLKNVVLLPRKALWCVSLFNSVLSIDLAEILASFSVPRVLLCRLLLPNGGVALGVW